MEKAYAAWRAFQDRFLSYAAAVLFVGSTLLALVEVVRRYLLGVSFEWQQDAVTYFILSGVFISFGASQRRDSHLAVTLVPELLSHFGLTKADVLIRLFARVFSMVFLIAVVWWGIPEIEDAIKYESRSESLSFPMWPFLAILIASFASMAITMIFQVYRAVQALRGITVLVEPHEAGDATH
jgi:TRAP-type C4-dicarboxylate transport system permease small subunit